MTVEPGAQLARVLLAQQPASLLLLDRGEELLGCIQALLPEMAEPAAKVKLQHIDPLAHAAALVAESPDALPEQGESLATLLQRMPVLLTADLIYIADINELAAAFSLLCAGKTSGKRTTVPVVHLLGALRDRVRGALFVAFDPKSGNRESPAGLASATRTKAPTLAKSDFIALGFVDATPIDTKSNNTRDGLSGVDRTESRAQNQHTDAPRTERLFRYSLRDYKAVPGWLNSKYWANPERWNVID